VAMALRERLVGPSGWSGLVLHPPALPDVARSRYGFEIFLVLGLSLGRSAVYSILSIVERETRGVPLAAQTSTLNSSATPDRPWLDLGYQLVGIGFAMVPVLLALYLLNATNAPAGRLVGLVPPRPRIDLLGGVVIAACIGIPGLGLYLGARALGFNTDVQASGLGDHWWTIPVLVLSAAQNAALEEVIMVGYLVVRLRQLGWAMPAVIAFSAVVRGSYHLYQGYGGFVGNLIMGVIFVLVFLRWRRVTPLVVAHTLLDVAAFVGYAVIAPRVSWL